MKDPEDYWWGAWGMNYWRYYTKDPGQDSFVYSNVGAGGRELKDGSMDQWSAMETGVSNATYMLTNP